MKHFVERKYRKALDDRKKKSHWHPGYTRSRIDNWVTKRRLEGADPIGLASNWTLFSGNVDCSIILEYKSGPPERKRYRALNYMTISFPLLHHLPDAPK